MKWATGLHNFSLRSFCQGVELKQSSYDQITPVLRIQPKWISALGQTVSRASKVSWSRRGAIFHHSEWPIILHVNDKSTEEVLFTFLSKNDACSCPNIVTPQKSGYRFLCCYSFLAFLSRIFPLEFGKWPDESSLSSTSQCFSHALVPVNPPSVNPRSHSNPSSEILEPGILPLCFQRIHHFPCSVDPPKIPWDPSFFLDPRCAKILPGHMQYLSYRINSFFCLSEELNPSFSRCHENFWRCSLWIYWALIKILAIIKLGKLHFPI
jgi:hypothetical protein